MRSVWQTVVANLVMGRIRPTWSSSCSEPMWAWWRGPWPPMTSMGVWARQALATAVTVSVVPGPAVTTAQPGMPVRRVQASAAWAAACS